MTAEIKTAEVALRDGAQTRAENIRTRLDSLTANINEIPALIVEAYEAGDWEALGYADWPAYVHGEYHTHLVKLSPAIRKAWSRDLKAVGMSTRQIAPVTNVSKAQAARDAAASPEASQASDPEDGIIDAEVVSDTAEPSKRLAVLVKMIDRVHTGIGYLARAGDLPEDLTPEQASAWYGMIAGKRGQGNAGLVKQLREFADKLSAAAGPK